MCRVSHLLQDIATSISGHPVFDIIRVHKLYSCVKLDPLMPLAVEAPKYPRISTFIVSLSVTKSTQNCRDLALNKMCYQHYRHYLHTGRTTSWDPRLAVTNIYSIYTLYYILCTHATHTRLTFDPLFTLGYTTNGILNIWYCQLY